MILARATELFEYSPNEWVIKPGDTFEGLYLFDGGHFDAYMNSQPLRSYRANDFLAPIEFLGGSLFGIKTKAKGGVFWIDKQTVECVVKEKLEARRERVQRVVDVKGIAMDAVKEIAAKEGEAIVSQGEEEVNNNTKNVFFIEEGEC